MIRWVVWLVGWEPSVPPSRSTEGAQPCQRYNRRQVAAEQEGAHVRHAAWGGWGGVVVVVGGGGLTPWDGACIDQVAVAIEEAIARPLVPAADAFISARQRTYVNALGATGGWCGAMQQRRNKENGGERFGE